MIEKSNIVSQEKKRKAKKQGCILETLTCEMMVFGFHFENQS